jgi:hypothetical protein
MKAIPTHYSGSWFRSRLEARWAAYFDILGLKWDYEPIDFDGWAPDFLIKTPYCPVFVEVKPTMEFSPTGVFAKAWKYHTAMQVMLLGLGPDEYGLGTLMDPPDMIEYEWFDLWEWLTDNPRCGEQSWREAGNRVQWRRVSA